MSLKVFFLTVQFEFKDDLCSEMSRLILYPFYFPRSDILNVTSVATGGTFQGLSNIFALDIGCFVVVVILRSFK